MDRPGSRRVHLQTKAVSKEVALIQITKRLQIVIDAMLEKKAGEITMMDLREATYFTDHFVICCGGSEPQIRSIYKNVDDKMSEEGIEAHHIEGRSESGWILMDYRDFVVHIFSPEKRSYYDLERLWGDAPRISIKDETARAVSRT